MPNTLYLKPFDTFIFHLVEVRRARLKHITLVIPSILKDIDTINSAYKVLHTIETVWRINQMLVKKIKLKQAYNNLNSYDKNHNTLFFIFL